MDPIFQSILLLSCLGAVAYALGSLNTAVIASRLAGRGDPRQMGSGNPGATNVLRSAGLKLALPILLVDLAKAALAIWLGRWGGLGESTSLLALPYLLGNLYPVFHGFRGGKGVAACVGLLFALHPLETLLGGLGFLLVVAIAKFVSLGSLFMLSSTAVWIWLLPPMEPWTTRIVAFTMAAVIGFTHRRNIQRLIRGTEPRLSFRRRCEQVQRTEGTDS